MTMQATDIVSDSVWEDGDAQIMARLTGSAGANITQASLTSIARKVFDLDSTTPDTPVATGAVTIATSVFDTLQTDARWSKDATGYNFRDTVAASVLTTGGHRYLVEYKITTSDSLVGWFARVLYATPVRTS